MTSIQREMLSAGSGCAIANGMLNAFETTKVKLQLHTHGIYRTPTMWGIMSQIGMEEGIVRGLLTPGLAASVVRSTLYGAYRVGLYPTIRDHVVATRRTTSGSSIVTTADPTLTERIISGMLTGALGSALSCPLDVVRTRMQADAGLVCSTSGNYTSGLRQGQPVRYKSMMEAFIKIMREEGLRYGLYRGASVTVTRATLLNGSQLGSYDSLKQFVKNQQHVEEGPFLHMCCAFTSGVIAQTVIMPIDTIKSHVMVGGQVHVLLRNPTMLFRGYLPACAGQGLVMVIQMPIIEEFRRLLGVKAI